MSVYDSSYSEANDSERTRRAKAILNQIITKHMAAAGYKTTIKTGCPATFIDPKPVCYHLDMGVLFRSKTEFDFYHFFALEVDDSHHATLKHEKKDEARDDSFFTNKGIITCRIPIDRIFDEKKDEAQFFDKWIYQDLLRAYILTPAESIKQEIWSELNRKFSIELKENSSTQCSKCDHKAHQHSLTGCEFRLTNKSKMKCNCRNPYFRSDE